MAIPRRYTVCAFASAGLLQLLLRGVHRHAENHVVVDLPGQTRQVLVSRRLGLTAAAAAPIAAAAAAAPAAMVAAVRCAPSTPSPPAAASTAARAASLGAPRRRVHAHQPVGQARPATVDAVESFEGGDGIGRLSRLAEAGGHVGLQGRHVGLQGMHVGLQAGHAWLQIEYTGWQAGCVGLHVG